MSDLLKFTPRGKEDQAEDARIRLRTPGDHVFVEEIGDGLEIWTHTIADPPYFYLMYRPPTCTPDALQRISKLKAGDPETLKLAVDASPIRIWIKRRNRPGFRRHGRGVPYYNQEGASASS